MSLRQVVNAILYVLKTGCQWRMLPREFPAGNAVYYDIVVSEAAGPERTVGSGVREEQEAQWIAQQLRGALGAAPRPV